jgi:CRP/FNR family cyclic AMP-dependent transcriptional regulator
MPVSAYLLGQIPLLRQLNADWMARLSERMVLQEFARRAMVLSRDAPAPSMGFLLEGRLQGIDFTVDGRSVGLFFVEAGDFFGDLSIVDAKPPAEFIMAATKSTVALLDAETARQLVFENPDVSRAIMLRLAARVRSVMAQRTLLSLPNPFQRLCSLLLQMAQNAQGKASATVEIKQTPTHQEMAIMINASRETVTRAFQQLFAQQVLVRDGDLLRVLKPEFVRDVAEGRQDIPKS